MNKCARCNGKIVKHLWVSAGMVYCSLKCERDCICRKQRGKVKHVRFCDKSVLKMGVAGLQN